MICLTSFKVRNDSTFLNVGHNVTFLTALFLECPKFVSEDLEIVD